MKKIRIIIPRIMNPHTFVPETPPLLIKFIKIKYPAITEITDSRITDDCCYAHFENDEDATAFILKYGEDCELPL